MLFEILQMRLTTGLLRLNPPKFSHISLIYFRPAAQTFLSMMQNHESHWPCDSNNTHLHTYNNISHKVRLIILGVHGFKIAALEWCWDSTTWPVKHTHFLPNLVNKTNLVHNLFLVYYQSLHVLGDYGPIIRRNSCVFVTLGTCYSVWMTIWYAGAYAPAYQMVIHVEIDKYTKNKLCTKLVLFTRLYSDAWSTKQKTSLHGQQNKKLPCMVNKTKNFLAWST